MTTVRGWIWNILLLFLKPRLFGLQCSLWLQHGRCFIWTRSMNLNWSNGDLVLKFHFEMKGLRCFQMVRIPPQHSAPQPATIKTGYIPHDFIWTLYNQFLCRNNPQLCCVNTITSLFPINSVQRRWRASGRQDNVLWLALASMLQSWQRRLLCWAPTSNPLQANPKNICNI